MQSVALQPDLVFPDLMDTCETVIGDILSNRLLGSTTLPYATAVEDHGGTRQVARECVLAIRPEIMRLQGRKVTRSALDNIKRCQDDDESWETGSLMGYLDYVVDDRVHEYFRGYSGQCINAFRRLFSQHAQSILQQSYETLHYYLL